MPKKKELSKFAIDTTGFISKNNFYENLLSNTYFYNTMYQSRQLGQSFFHFKNIENLHGEPVKTDQNIIL